MSTPTAPPSSTAKLLTDVWVIAKRGLLHMRRQPEAFADATIQPIMFVLLFGFVFGHAIGVEGGSYREFLMGGIMAQTLAFASFNVAISLAHDRTNGAIDRFRALPLSRGAILGGNAVANTLRGFVPIVIMSLCGLIIGWRVRGSLLDAIAAYLLMILIVFTMIWVGMLMAASLTTPEAVQGVAFIIIFPVTFIASTFVSITDLPTGLRQIAEWNPITAWAEGLRRLFGNPHAPEEGVAWAVRNPVLYSVITSVVIIGICAPLAIRGFNRSLNK